MLALDTMESRMSKAGLSEVLLQPNETSLNQFSRDHETGQLEH